MLIRRHFKGFPTTTAPPQKVSLLKKRASQGFFGWLMVLALTFNLLYKGSHFLLLYLNRVVVPPTNGTFQQKVLYLIKSS